MKIGICGGAANLRQAKSMGYDYMEASASAIAAMTQEEFAALAAENDAVRDAAFEGVKVCNGLFPGDLTLVGPAAELAKVRAYLEHLLPRLERLGVETIVFGSGAARKCPEGFDADTAIGQLVEVARLVAELADAHGIRVGMEHLNTSETNNLNTVAETYAFVQKAAEGLPAGAPVPGITMDTYHVTRENEPLKVILPLFGAVYHCHTAHPDGRGPVTAEDLPYLCAVMGGLMAAGYNGRFSLECGLPDYEKDGACALVVLRAAAAVCEL
jgi:sugar phosphate isomerase/epimerase